MSDDGPQTRSAEVKRDARGRVVKGSGSVNPGGQPKYIAAVREQFKASGLQVACETLVSLAKGETTTVLVYGVETEVSPDLKLRLEASKEIVSYFFSKPKPRDMDADGEIEARPEDAESTEVLLDLLKLAREKLQ